MHLTSPDGELDIEIDRQRHVPGKNDIVAVAG
jgi:hypothetical protein